MRQLVVPVIIALAFGSCIWSLEPFHRPTIWQRLSTSYAYSDGDQLVLFVQVDGYRTHSRFASPPYIRSTNRQTRISCDADLSVTNSEFTDRTRPFSNNMNRIVRAFGDFHLVAHDGVSIWSDDHFVQLNRPERDSFLAKCGVDEPSDLDNKKIARLAEEDGWMQLLTGDARNLPTSNKESDWFELGDNLCSIHYTGVPQGETIELRTAAGDRIELIEVATNRKLHTTPRFIASVSLTIALGLGIGVYTIVRSRKRSPSPEN